MKALSSWFLGIAVTLAIAGTARADIFSPPPMPRGLQPSTSYWPCVCNSVEVWWRGGGPRYESQLYHPDGRKIDCGPWNAGYGVSNCYTLRDKYRELCPHLEIGPKLMQYLGD